jgi:hypothetical protein
MYSQLPAFKRADEFRRVLLEEVLPKTYPAA